MSKLNNDYEAAYPDVQSVINDLKELHRITNSRYIENAMTMLAYQSFMIRGLRARLDLELEQNMETHNVED